MTQKYSVLFLSLILAIFPISPNFYRSKFSLNLVDNSVVNEWENILESPGIKLYRQDEEYVQLINLSEGASIQFIYGKMQYLNRGQGAYGGDEPQLERQTVEQFWSEMSPINSQLFCLSNGQFFRNDRNASTGLAFPVKSNGKVVSDGYAGEIEFPREKLILAVWENRAEIVPFHPLYLRLSTAPDAIVGLKEDADKGVLNETGRTFMGVKDIDGDRLNETVLIFTAKKATQTHAAEVLKNFGATAVLMLDGGGSTQLFCQGTSYVNSPRTVPQAIAVFSGGQKKAVLKGRGFKPNSMVNQMRMARLELARQSHTPLKRARIPIPPHPLDRENLSN